MEIGFRSGIDIMHVWNSQFIRMKIHWGFVCVCACMCVRICIHAFKLTDEYTNGICVVTACEVSWYVMGDRQAGSDSKNASALWTPTQAPADSQSSFAASMKMPLSYQGCLASKQASGHRASRGVYFPRNNGQAHEEKVNLALSALWRSPT